MPTDPVLIKKNPNNWVTKRAQFATKTIWVSKYEEGERYPAGEYPNQSARLSADGLPAYVEADESIVNEDIVMWHSFGLNHVVRIEDWPVMPKQMTGFFIEPYGFFRREPHPRPARRQRHHHQPLQCRGALMSRPHSGEKALSSPGKLKANSLGLWDVVFMAVATSAPITVMSGNVPFAVGFGVGTGTPATYSIWATVILTIFAVGYVTMAKYVYANGGLLRIHLSRFGTRVWSRHRIHGHLCLQCF